MIEREVFSFAGRKLNWDDDFHLMPLGDSRARVDIVYPNGNNSVIESRRVGTLIQRTLPPAGAGVNKCIGYCQDIENNAVIYVLYNPIGNHTITRLNVDNTFTNISLHRSEWNFQSDKPMTKMEVIGTGDDAMLFMNDGYNSPFLVNIAKLMNGDYPTLAISEISLLKPRPLYKPSAIATQRSGVTKTNIINKVFQFKYVWIFDTGQKSQPSHESDLVYDYSNETVGGQFDLGMDTTTSKKNTIEITLNRGFSNVEKIELYVRNADIGSGVRGSWFLYDTIDVDTDTYIYYFYNDRPWVPPLVSVNYNFDNVPITSQVAEIADNRIILGQNNMGYDNVEIDIELFVERVFTQNPSTIETESANPYIATTNIDIVYNPSDLKSINVVIAKVINSLTEPTVESYENYYYLYKSASAVNTDIIAFFVTNINNNTDYSDITMSSIAGGTPNMLSLENSNTELLDVQYFIYSFTSPLFSKTLTVKENSTQNLAIAYYDQYGRSGRCMVKDLQVKIPSTPTTNLNGYHTNYIKYQINHEAPDWATYYQFLRGDSDVLNHFSIPMLIKGFYGDTADIVEDGMVARMDVDAAINRFYEVNEYSTLNSFDVQKGDRARVLGYIVGSQQYRLTQNIDVPVVDIDEDGKVLVPSLSALTQRLFGGFNIFKYTYPGDPIPRYAYLVEFYRPSSSIEQEDRIYYEIGDLLTITNGYHNTSSIIPLVVPAVNQSDGVPGVGVINYGDTYRLFYHYGARFINDSSETLLKPMFCNVESNSASFNYDSLFHYNPPRSIGRFNTADSSFKNETTPTLIYGGFYRSGDLNYNDLNRFVNDPEYLDAKYGTITGIVNKGNTIEVYQQKKVSTKYLNAVVETLADGSTQTMYSSKFLNDGGIAPYDFGCSHTSSIAKNLYSTYFFDLATSAWYRRSQNGIINITDGEFKVKNYGISLAKTIAEAIKSGHTYEIMTGYDHVKDIYLFSYRDLTTTQTTTLGFHEPTNSWLSFYTYEDEMYFSMNGNRFFGVNDGAMYEYHISETRVSTGIVQFHFNKYPVLAKIFRDILLDADQVWTATLEGDIIINDGAIAHQHPDSYERFFSKMSSLLREHHFKYYENKFHAYFLRNMLNRAGVSRGKISLVNGELLRGNVVSVILRNSKINKNQLRFVTIGFENSM